MSYPLIVNKEKENRLLDDHLNNIANRTVQNKKNITLNEESTQQIDFSHLNNQSYTISITDEKLDSNDFTALKNALLNKENTNIITETDINTSSNISQYPDEKNFFLGLYPISLIIQ